MDSSNTVRVEYIGSKPEKVDNVAGTGIRWAGPGDVQTVPLAAWAKLTVHPTVWREAIAESAAPRGLASAAPKAPPAPAPSPAPAPAPAPAKPPVNEQVANDGEIYGTSHPAEIDVAGTLLDINDVIQAAFQRSGLTALQWNELADPDRFDFVEQHITLLRQDVVAKQSAAASAAQTTGQATAPATKPARAPRAPKEPDAAKPARGRGKAPKAEA